MDPFSIATDTITLLKANNSSSTLIIAPISHCNLGRFFNSPSKKKGSCLPRNPNLEVFKISIERQVRVVFRSIRKISIGEHLVWNYDYK